MPSKNHPMLRLLVHSDLKVVDESKKVIAESFVEYQGLEIKRNKFPNIVISNLVTGCTALFNEELAQIALPIPDNAIMHDWWLAPDRLGIWASNTHRYASRRIPTARK